jgi:hypothetical protein
MRANDSRRLVPYYYAVTKDNFTSGPSIGEARRELAEIEALRGGLALISRPRYSSFEQPLGAEPPGLSSGHGSRGSRGRLVLSRAFRFGRSAA